MVPTCGPVRRQSQHVKDEDNPPVLDISASSKRVTDNHNVVARGVEISPGLVCHGNLFERDARLERETWNDMDGLV